jgi:hypothetical protein
MKRQFHLKTSAVLCAIAWMAAGGAQAQIEMSVDISNLTPATDALGRNLPGSWSGDEAAAARVEIREVGGGGIIAPPDPVTGAGNDAVNPLVRVSRIGMQIVPPTNNTGRFCEIFTNRMVLIGKTCFARVYDSSSPSAAIYFADSAPFSDVPSGQWGTVHAIDVVFQPLRLVSTGEADSDSDGDGIPDAMEMDLGLDPNGRDTDEDGYPDGFEVLHNDYLHPKAEDPIDIRIAAPSSPGSPEEHTVAWWAIPGVGYRLEYRPRWVDGDAYEGVWSGTATETNWVISVEDVVTNTPVQGFFRWVVP